MLVKIKSKIYNILRWSEKYTKTDMVYLAQGGFWVNATLVINSIFAFILSIIFAKFVTKEIYGTYQFLISISSILAATTLTGMNTAVTQATARGFEAVFKNSVKIQIKFGIIPFLAGLIVSLYYLISGNQTISIAILLIAILLPFANALNTWGSFLTGKKKFKNLFFYSQIINLTYYLGMIVCILIFPHAIGLILTNFFLVTITNLLVYFIIIKKYQPNQNNEIEAIKYGKKLSLSNILPLISSNIDNIIIFHFLGASQLAIYAFASNVPERLGGLLRPITTLALPKLATKTPTEVKIVLLKKTLQLFALSLVFGAIYIIFSPFIFKIFFPLYTESIFYSQIYMISVLIYTTASLPIVALFSTRSNKIFNFNIFNPLFNIFIIITLVYFFGIWGAILGKIIGNSFSLLYSYILNKKTSAEQLL